MNYWINKQRPKFKAQRIKHHGISFASKLEASVYDIICLRIKAGEFKSVKSQTHIKLTDAEITYIPDFECTDENGTATFVEAKGYETPEWKLKKRLWKYYGPGKLEIWGGSYGYRNPKLVETIIPKERKCLT